MGPLLSLARTTGDLLFAPFVWLPPALGLILLSLVSGVLLLLAFRLLTPQVRLQRVKDRMSATIYEMRLFSAAPMHLVRTQGRAIVLTGQYLGLALPSFVLLVPILGLLLARAALVYEVSPLEVGETVRVTVTLDPPLSPGTLVVEPAGPGLRLVPPILLVDSGRIAHARVKALSAGEHTLRLRTGDSTVEKTVQAAMRGPVSPERALAGSWLLLLSREAPLEEGGPIRGITVHYPAASLSWLGLPWYVHLFAISLVAALALRRRLGVVF